MTFGVEDFGASPLAERFGIDKYPALFIDDVLVARPEDFYAWGGPGDGRYLPWKELANRKKYQEDVKRMIEIRLAGGSLEPSKTKQGSASAIAQLPALELVDLAGKKFSFAAYRGKPLLIEFWAPWCPPCLETLAWLRTKELRDVQIIGIAVQSERANVDKVLAKSAPPGRYVMATAPLLAAFGDIAAVPTMFLADRDGNVVKVFYGAPPDLHEQVERELVKLR